MFSVYVLPLVTVIGPIDPLYPPHTPETLAVMVSLVALPVAFAQRVYVEVTLLPLHDEPAAIGPFCGADASRIVGERRTDARLLSPMTWMVTQPWFAPHGLLVNVL
jgi:hypothetical protein